jgi:hypothetical protein
MIQIQLEFMTEAVCESALSALRRESRFEEPSYWDAKCEERREEFAAEDARNSGYC